MMVGVGYYRRLSCAVALLIGGYFTAAAAAASGDAPPANDFGLAQVSEINSQIRGLWSEYSIQPSSPATEGESCRRMPS